MRFLDSNVILRYFVWDDPAKAERAKRLFAQVQAGRERLLTSALGVAEVVWVAESRYGYPRPKLVELIHSLLNTPNLEFDRKDLLLAAANLFEVRPIDFLDAYNAVYMQAVGLQQIYSYDTDFDVISGLQRLEP
jgi:predicted nucleic acid-binding protein